MTPQEALTKIGNCQTQVGMPVFKFKRKEYQIVQKELTKKEELVETIESCVELLNQDGINSKQIVKEILKQVLCNGCKEGAE
jgi:predicted transcriptional regulator